MPLTLAIATATGQVSVAVGDGSRPLAQIDLMAPRRHGETLAPALRAAADLAGVRLSNVEKVAVDAGPGLFTGLRVGVATAKALAAGLGVPLVARSSLEILAHPHRLSGRPVASVVDARRGEVFWAVHPVDPEPHCDPPDVVAELVAAHPEWLVTGDGARRYLPADRLAAEEYDHPSAEALLALVPDDPGGDPQAVTPLYLRGADVRIGWEQR